MILLFCQFRSESDDDRVKKRELSRKEWPVEWDEWSGKKEEVKNGLLKPNGSGGGHNGEDPGRVGI